MSIQERILQVIDLKSITAYRFCKDLGFSMGYLDKRGAIGTDKYLKIIEYLKDINPIWLLTGKGNMLKNEVQKEVSAPVTGQNVGVLEDKIGLLEKNIATLEAQIKDKEEKEALYKDKIQRLERELKEYQKSSAIYTGQRQNIQPTL